jgi:hypothetical protein
MTFAVEPRFLPISYGLSGAFAGISLGLNEGDYPVRLRFRLGTTTAGGAWSVDLKSAQDVLAVTSDTYSDITEGPRGLEISVRNPFDLQVRTTGNPPPLFLTGLMREKTGQRQEFIMSQDGHPHFLYYQKDLAGRPTELSVSRAIVRLDFELAAGHSPDCLGPATCASSCTGFQISPGYFLTNRHCVDPAFRSGLLTTIIFGIDDKNPDGVDRTSARLFSMGSYPTGSSTGGLDYGILKAVSVPQPFKGALVDIWRNGKTVPASETSLELYQIWTGLDGQPKGNAVTTNAECKVGSVSKTFPGEVNNPYCPVPDFIHGCDEDSGSSGSPVFVRGTNTVVGLN